MGITVRLFANFREAAGTGQLEIPGAKTVGELLDILVEKFGENFSKLLYEEPGTKKLRTATNIFVNGQAIAVMNGLDTKLKDGDSVAIFPPVAGGSFFL
ncbi:MAG: ubiquitin-like small modifier protein 1 [Candidatus Hadarchaeales archaeon]